MSKELKRPFVRVLFFAILIREYPYDVDVNSVKRSAIFVRHQFRR